MVDGLILREITEEDCELISIAFQKQGWNKPIQQYQEYVEMQERKSRDVIVALLDGDFAGYLTINWVSDYGPFRSENIPEIVDFNVLMKYQRLGVGTQLMDEAERRVRTVSKSIGIGFGLYKDYGAAQILYVKRGYVPDGRGIVKNSISLKYGDQVAVDDSLVLYLTKEL